MTKKYENEIKKILMNEGEMNLTSVARRLSETLRKEFKTFDRETFTKAVIELEDQDWIVESKNIYRFKPRYIQ